MATAAEKLAGNLNFGALGKASELKNRLLKSVSAVSIVGGSPGLKILKTSNKASSLDLALSN